jgi:hypothetical protein
MLKINLVLELLAVNGSGQNHMKVYCVTDSHNLSDKGKVERKGKVVLVHDSVSTEDKWGSGGTAPPYLTLPLDVVEYSASRHGCVTHVERASST